MNTRPIIVKLLKQFLFIMGGSVIWAVLAVALEITPPTSTLMGIPIGLGLGLASFLFWNPFDDLIN